MAQKFSFQTISRFSYILRYNIQTYLDLYSVFVRNNMSNIIDFYKDSDTNTDVESFNFLFSLLVEAGKIDNLIKLNKNSFNSIDDWELLDFMEEIRGKLLTISNTHKWTRSSKTQNSWTGSNIQTNYVLQDNQTLEEVSKEVYGELESQNDWMRISIENDVREADYSPNSNKQIQVNKRVLSTPDYAVFSVVDSLVNEKLYGLDMMRKLTFVDDDLQVNDHESTVHQTVEILIALHKGDIPEYPAIGVDSKLAIGSNVGAIQYTSIVRQLEEVFRTDDSLRNFKVTSISYQSGDLIIQFSVDTMYNLTIQNSKSKI